MSPVLLTIVALCLLIAVLVFFFRPYDYGASVQRFRKIGDAGDNPEPGDNTQWRSVRVRPGLICCKQVDGIADQVFLSSEAPRLPLPDCSETDCSCHYLFLGDRRSGIDRRVELRKLASFVPDVENGRRRAPGRRIGDLVPV